VNVLAFDAALGPFSVALDLGERRLGERSDRHDALEAGLERIARLLASASVELSAIDRIGVGVGPGSFTGLRIALSFAKAIAYAAGIPLVGISSYDILADGTPAGPRLVLVRGRAGIVCARLTTDGREEVACGPTGTVVAGLVAKVADEATLTIIAATEDVFAEIGERSGPARRIVSAAAADPAAVIARLSRHREPGLSPHGIAPDYGELPAVTIPTARARTAP
jgi:tRNA threonylcarbamoyladenosine biosynthesis protein TsaB